MIEFTWYNGEVNQWYIAHLTKEDCEECIDWAEANQITYSYTTL